MKKIKTLNIRKPYIQKNMVISEDNIDMFRRPEWHREFRENHVRNIMAAMKRGEHPSENITVNEITNKKYVRVLNGNHRILAIKRVIEENKKFSIEMTITVYNNLEKEQEIEIYEKVNNTKRETGLDKLKAHLTGTKIHKLMMENFPFRLVYRSISKSERNVMKVSEVLASYIVRNKPGVSLGVTQTIKQAIKLDEQDFDRMVEFAKTFKEICGEPSKDNMYSSYNIYNVLGKLYYTLVGVDLTRDEYIHRIKQVLIRYTSELIMYSKGVHQQRELYLFVFKKVKKGRRMYNVITGEKE